MQCATVKVKATVTEQNSNGFIVINKSDFDEKNHTLHVDEAEKSDGETSGQAADKISSPKEKKAAKE